MPHRAYCPASIYKRAYKRVREEKKQAGAAGRYRRGENKRCHPFRDENDECPREARLFRSSWRLRPTRRASSDASPDAPVRPTRFPRRDKRISVFSIRDNAVGRRPETNPRAERSADTETETYEPGDSLRPLDDLIKCTSQARKKPLSLTREELPRALVTILRSQSAYRACLVKAITLRGTSLL